MKKRNVGLKSSFMKILGVAMSASLLFSLNVHAEEAEDLVDSEDITSISDGIDILDDKVNTLNDNCSDDGVSQDISEMSAEIAALNERVSNFNKKYNNFLLTIDKNRQSIIKGLNKSVYASNNISENATYSDIISKIDDIKYHGTLNVNLGGDDKYTLESGYYEGGTIDISAIVEAARQEGKEEGFKLGKEKGYKDGFGDGKDAGEEVGKDSLMTEAENYISMSKSCSIVISPSMTYKSYNCFYIKNSNDHGTPLNSNDVVRLWIKGEGTAWGKVVVDIPISECIYAGDGWYKCGTAEGITMVEVINNNNVSRDYKYHYGN